MTTHRRDAAGTNVQGAVPRCVRRCPCPVPPQIRILGALLTHPTGASAARLYDLPVPDTTSEHLPDRRTREGIVSHVAHEQPVSIVLAIEYDGQQHRADLKQWDSDIGRGDWLERNGWRVLPVISKGVYRRPDQTVERVFTALQQCGYPKLPRALSDEWRLHFPVRP